MIENNAETRQAIMAFGYSLSEIGTNMAVGLKEKLDELYELVRSLNVRDSKGDYTKVWNYLDEAYDNYLVYSVEEEGKDRKTYKVNYQFNVTSGEPEFVGDPVEVERKVTYEVVPQANQIKFNRTKTIKTMAEKCTPCVEKRVNTLVANKATKFTEADKEWLQTLSEEQLDQMIPEVEEPIVDNATAPALSAEDKAALDFGKKMLAKKKADMANCIQANTAAGVWTPEVLAAMPEDMLERVYNSVKPVEHEIVDYSLNGNPPRIQANANVEAPMTPAGITLKS